MKILQIVVTALALNSLAFGANIAVSNTGVNSGGTLVAPGAATSFWTLSSEPVGGTLAIGSNPFRYRTTAYFADTATAAWVAPTAAGNAGVIGFYTYDLVLDLTGLNPATASITGFFGTDNDGSIFLNNNAPVATTGFTGFGTATNFTINTGFIAGLNTIHVRLDNGGDPTAFFVQFTSAAASAAAVSGVPEPTTLLIAGGGLALLALRRKRSAVR